MGKMTPEQRQALDAVRKAARQARVARSRAETAQAAYVAALEDTAKTVPVAEIADALKVRREGIYQTIKRATKRSQ